MNKAYPVVSQEVVLINGVCVNSVLEDHTRVKDYWYNNYREIIQSKLYFLAKENKIFREKQGNTYKLFTDLK